MSLRAVATRPGADALGTLRALLAELRGNHPLSPATVIVPTNAVGVTARRGLAASGGIAGVQFLTLYRLAEQLGGPQLAAEGRTPISAAMLTGFLRSSVDRRRHTLLASVGTHPTTVDALRRTYREIRELPPAPRRILAESGSPLTRELLDIHALTEAALQPEWYDEADLYAAGLSVALDSDPSVLRARLGPVIVHLPSRLSEPAISLIRALSVATPTVVCIAMTGDREADSLVGALCERLDCPAPLPPPGSSGAAVIDVLDASDADDEVRAVVRRVYDAAAQGVGFDRMAILWTNDDPYARSLCEALDAADVPWNGPHPQLLLERIAPRTLLGLFRAAARGWTRSDVMALVAGAPVRVGGRPAPVVAWERISRQAGVARGDDWSTKLLRFAERSSPADETVTRFADFVTALQEDLLPTRRRRWAEWCAWSDRMLRVLLGGEQVRAAWPAADQRAADTLALVLQRVSALDAIEPPPDPARFATVVGDVLSATLVRGGSLGNGVTVGPVQHAHGLDADVVFLIGAADELLPASVPADPLLGEADRERVRPFLLSRDEQRAAQRAATATALCCSARVVVTYARGDLRRSSTRRLSPWIAELTAESTLRSVPIPSFARGVVDTVFPVSEWEHRLRDVAAADASGVSPGETAVAMADVELRRALRLVTARASDSLTVFDGDLSGCSIPSPFRSGEAVGPTRLESWVACPHAYFVEHILGVRHMDNPEDLVTMPADELGKLIHSTLDDVVQRVLRGELPDLDDANTWGDDHIQAMFEVLSSHAGRKLADGLAGRPTLWEYYYQRHLADVARFMQADSTRLLGQRPIASEVQFGDVAHRHSGAEPDWAAPRLALPGGRSIAFSGAIDRVDQAPNGELAVLDYKTGSRTKFSAITPENPTAGGTRLQLIVYGLAAAQHHSMPIEQVRADYVFIGKGATARDSDIGLQLSPLAVDHATAVLSVIADMFDAGLFPPRPAPPSSFNKYGCKVCDPDELGTGFKHRIWERKRHDPRVRAYATMTGDVPGDVTADPTDDGAD